MNRYGRIISGIKHAGAIGLLLACTLIINAPASAASETARIVALGDSLTAGLGVAPGDAFPAKLQAALQAGGHNVEIINAGVSGDTSSGGLARLDWALGEGADGVIVELGSNDALRGLDPADMARNLDAILQRLSARDIPVLVAGMRAPPNLGSEYAAEFEPVFADLAEKYGALLYPFFLDGVAAQRDLNQADQMHPNAAGVDVIVARILPYVEQLLAQRAR